MHAAIILDASLIEALHHNASVFLVISNIFAAFLHALRAVSSLSATLHDVGHAIELGGLAAQPHLVQLQLAAIGGFANQCLGHNGVATASAGEATGFGHGAQLDGAFFSILDYENAARNSRVSYECFISSIIEDYCIIFQSISNPFFQLLLSICSTGGVIRRAQINNICLHIIIRHGQKVVFGATSHENNLATAHNIGVQIYGINRVRNQNGIGIAKDIGDIAAVTLSAVADEDFIAVQGYAKVGIILNQCFVQEVIALLRAIAAEGFLHAHFGNCLGHRFYYAGCQWTGYVANAQANYLFIRMSSCISTYLVSNICEEIGFLQITIIFVYKSHFKYKPPFVIKFKIIYVLQDTLEAIRCEERRRRRID